MPVFYFKALCRNLLSILKVVLTRMKQTSTSRRHRQTQINLAVNLNLHKCAAAPFSCTGVSRMSLPDGSNPYDLNRADENPETFFGDVPLTLGMMQ